MIAQKVIIPLSHLPDPDLSPNKRLNWRAKYRITKEAKDEIFWIVKQVWQNRPPLERAKISYYFYTKDNRGRDLDNLIASCKAYQDGLVAGGLLIDDDSRHLEFGNVKVYHKSGKNETIIEVEEIK